MLRRALHNMDIIPPTLPLRKGKKDQASNLDVMRGVDFVFVKIWKAEVPHQANANPAMNRVHHEQAAVN